MELHPALVTETMNRLVKGLLLALLAVVVVIVVIAVIVSMSSDSGASPFVYDGF